MTEWGIAQWQSIPLQIERSPVQIRLLHFNISMEVDVLQDRNVRNILMWGYGSVVERSLSMGEGWGSIPHISTSIVSDAKNALIS